MLWEKGNPLLSDYLSQGEFGVERESLRVCRDGTLAQSPHPFGAHKNIDRDFCENQIELITDVFTRPEQVNEQLRYLQQIVNGQLKVAGEYLWPFSNPPKISGEEEIPVAFYSGHLQGKSVYRHYLAEKYGKRKMLFSGIHLNLSFAESLIQAAFVQSGVQNFVDFKNQLYLTLAERLTEYAWLVVYLTAASPVTDASLGTNSNVYASVRCSEVGYWNHFTPILNYGSLSDYIGSIRRYIDEGNLRSVSELYYPVRVKPRGVNTLETLAEKGINHLELRVLDVNPLSPTGIFAEDMYFVYLLLLYLTTLPHQHLTEEEQVKAINDVKAAAVFGNPAIRERAENVLNEIQAFVEEHIPSGRTILDYQRRKSQVGGSYAEQVSQRFGEDYMTKGLALAKEYQRSVGYV